jgi:hypothetical protein
MDIRSQHNHFQIQWGTLLAVALCFGCGSSSDGPDLGLVEGTVTLDGGSLANALVVFNPANGKQSNGQTDAEGHYSLTYLRDIKGAVVGKHGVIISTQSEFNPEELVPRGYNRSSALTANVEAGKNSFDFDLKSDFQIKR